MPALPGGAGGRHFVGDASAALAVLCHHHGRPCLPVPALTLDWEVCWVKIMVVKAPKMFRGLLRKVFGIGGEE